RTASSARFVAATLTLQADHLVPELLVLGPLLGHPDELRLQVLVQTPGPVLPADPGLLVPAERPVRPDQLVLVDPAQPALQPPDHGQRPPGVPRPHAGR